MGRRRISLAGVLLTLGACASSPADVSEHPLAWLTGCWEAQDGTSREVWSQPETGYLFAYSLNYKDGAVSFFEHLRIDPGEVYVLNAYPAGTGPSPFFETDRGPAHVTFTNAEHDFPQVITYAMKGDALTAHVATLDETRGFNLYLRPCARR